MSNPKRITEQVAKAFQGVTVDREKGTISPVLICGFESANNRTYLPAALREAVPKYEGISVNEDHSRDDCDSRVGWLTNVYVGDDGRPRGTLNVLLTSKLAPMLFEAAERNPRLFGLSHVANCKTRYDHQTGKEIVESISEVISVDVVRDPATNPGLTESRRGPTMPMTTIKKFLESVAQKATVSQILKVKKLSEMEGMAELPMPEPASEDTPEDGIKEAFKAAIMSVVDGALEGGGDAKEALGKIKKLLMAHGDVNGDGKIDSKDVDAAGEGSEGTEEGKKGNAGSAILEALAVAEKVGLKADRTDLEVIAATPKERREAVATKLLNASAGGTGSGKAKSFPRGQSTEGNTQPIQESKVDLSQGWIE
jgi:hypothetical protein